MQTQKWVNLGLLFSSAALFIFVSRLVGMGWDLARLPIPAEWPVEPVYLIGFVAAVAVGVMTRRNEAANTFFNEVVLELSRVTWPTRKETVASAGVVVVLIAICAVILFLIDSLWGTMIRGILAI
jgi:preprotein translocase subunit SecE